MRIQNLYILDLDPLLCQIQVLSLFVVLFIWCCLPRIYKFCQNVDELTYIIVEAVKRAGIRAILSKGWSARGVESKSPNSPSKRDVYPDCIYPIASVPHDWLFPQLSGVVHHGGAGTTSAGMRAGVPSLIKPFFGDQVCVASTAI